MGRFSLYFCFFCLLFLVLFIVGCGLKTMPVPPQTVVPAPIEDLGFSLDEKGVSMSWSYPRKMTNGDDLTRIDSFELFRAVVPVDEYCATCPLPFGPPIKIEGGLIPEDGSSRTAQYTETFLRPGHRYFYKVQARTGWWIGSRDSNMVSFAWDFPAGAPVNLEIKDGDQVLYLSWQRPETLVDGTSITDPLFYQVFRSKQTPKDLALENGKEFVSLGEPITETRFTDDTVINGKRYYYIVRALRNYEGTLLIGSPSRVEVGDPKDLTPPAPPGNLIAVGTSAGIKLFWEQAEQDDVVGYRIYRRQGDGKPFFLGEVAAPITTFVDGKPPAGEAISYFVTAFDNAEPPNESPSSIPALLDTEYFSLPGTE